MPAGAVKPYRRQQRLTCTLCSRVRDTKLARRTLLVVVKEPFRRAHLNRSLSFTSSKRLMPVLPSRIGMKYLLRSGWQESGSSYLARTSRGFGAASQCERAEGSYRVVPALAQVPSPAALRPVRGQLGAQELTHLRAKRFFPRREPEVHTGGSLLPERYGVRTRPGCSTSGHPRSGTVRSGSAGSHRARYEGSPGYRGN